MSRTSERSRTVKRPNRRWDRQRPITRGGSDHEEAGLLPTITSLTPTDVVTTDPDTLITVTGTNFVDPASVHITGSNGPEEFAATVNSATELEFTLLTSYTVTGGGHSIQVETTNGVSTATGPANVITIDTL